VRPKSEGYHLAGFSGGDEPYAKYVQTAENETFPSSPTEGISNGMEVKRSGGMLGRSSPVKRSGRSKSPKKRPYSTPTLSSPQEVPSHGRDEEQDESDTDADCPDTPTPMTNSQKRSAYVPLGTPTPLPYPKRSPRPKDSPQSPPTPQENTTPSSETKPRTLPHLYSHLKPSVFDDIAEGPMRTTRTMLAARATDELHKANQPFYDKRSSSSSYGYDVQKGEEYYAQDDQEEHYPQQYTQDPAYRQQHDQPTFHTVPSPSQYAQHSQLPPQHLQQLLPRELLPSATVARHISISATSNVSGGTATSKKSIFSTPGRDELERKKALVEADEGPFARVASVADLNASRRVISGEVGNERESVRERMGKKVEEKGGRICGMGACNVM
jgi:hypothetical protein